LKPQKGGRAIHPADVIEQRGKLTPLQMHRILSTLHQRDPTWTVERIARAYDVEVRTIESMQKHLSLPFVFQDDTKIWQGTTEEPTQVVIQRSMGNKVELNILGQHIRVEKKAT
jgi:hypothetical protein